MKKKNYSVIIAIALIALLVIAIVCMGCERNTSNPEGDLVPDTVKSGDEIVNTPKVPDVNENVEWDEEGNKVNVSKSINKEKMRFGDIDLTNISFKFADGITDFTANVKNNSDRDYPMGMEMKIIFYDSEKNVIFETFVMTSSLLARGESNIQSRFLRDCSYAETFDIIIAK